MTIQQYLQDNTTRWLSIRIHVYSNPVQPFKVLCPGWQPLSSTRLKVPTTETDFAGPSFKYCPEVRIFPVKFRPVTQAPQMSSPGPATHFWCDEIILFTEFKWQTNHTTYKSQDPVRPTWPFYMVAQSPASYDAIVDQFHIFLSFPSQKIPSDLSRIGWSSCSRWLSLFFFGFGFFNSFLTFYYVWLAGEQFQSACIATWTSLLPYAETQSPSSPLHW